MGWSEIVAEERKYLTNLGYKLTELQSMTQGNMALEQIYAGFFSAYQKGLQSLASFEQDMGNIEKAINTGQLQQDHIAMLQRVGVDQDRWIAAMNLVACMRCLDRPSEQFRAELRRQQKAIIGSLQKILADKTLDTSGLAHDLKFIGELLSSFELPTPEQPKGGLRKFLTPTTLAMTGVGLMTGFGIKALIEYRSKKKAEQAKAEEQKESQRLENKATSTSKRKLKSNPLLKSKSELVEEDEDDNDTEAAEVDVDKLERLLNSLETDDQEEEEEESLEEEDDSEEDEDESSEEDEEDSDED